VASRLLSWIRDPDGPQILGDLSEEYGERARSLGAAAARRWYWRETIRNAGVLLWRKRIVGTTVIAWMAFLTVAFLRYTLSKILGEMWVSRQIGFPAVYLVQELCFPIVGVVVGYVFAVTLPDRAKHMRITYALLCLLNSIWFALWLFAFPNIHRFVLVQPAMKERLLFQFLGHQAVAAGLFFIGAGAGMRRRKVAVTQ